MADAPDLFLSHNSEDKPLVREVAEALRRRRFKPWLDVDELIPGHSWQPLAERAIKICRAGAVFVGQSGLGPWQKEEMWALLDLAVASGLPVIPVLLPGAPKKPDLPLFLRGRTWVDLREDGISKTGIDRIVWGITGKKPRSRKTTVNPDLPGPPPLHNLPFSPLGDLFKGRDDELRALAASLRGDGKARVIAQDHRALYGLGGIGKTRLAVEYAWRFGSRYKKVLFVRAESPEALGTGFASLAPLLGQPMRQSQDETAQVVFLWLQTNPGWLLILDNVDSKEAERAVLEILPRLNGGHVLITSRLKSWPRSVSRQELDTVSPEEAKAFLLERTEGERIAAADDEAQASRLAERLDGLPLALEQAGAYISHVRLSFEDYLKVWDEEKARMLDWHDETMGYPVSVAATWKASFDRLQPGAANLLRMMAFLAPEPIPEKMFESEGEAVAIREALAELESYSLISREGSACSVHRVVQEVVQSQIPKDERREWIEGALKAVNTFSPVPPDDVRTWPIWDLLRPHASRIVLLADESGVTDPTSRLMNELGLYLDTRALYTEAELLMRRALAIAEEDGQGTSFYLNNLALLLKATNRLSEAEPLMRRALAIDEATPGNDHPTVAIRLNNLASLLQATNRLSEAEPLMARVVTIFEGSLGEHHPNVAIALNNLAQLLKATNRLSEAEPLMRRALAIDEDSFGNEHPNVAIALNNLALLLQATNRPLEAEPLMRRALAIDEDSFGNEHPNVARDLNNLAQLLQATNRLSEAEPLMRRAVEILEKSLGPDHPLTQRGQRNLKLLLAEIGGGGPEENPE